MTYIKNLYNKIKNLIIWFPIIWNDKNWDYAYLLQILEFKLTLMRNTLKDNDITTSANRQVKQIDYALYLLKEKNYIEKEEKLWESKWGEKEYFPEEFKGTHENKFVSYTRMWTTDKIKTEEEYIQAYKEQMEIYDLEYKRKEKEWDRLFRHLKLYMRGWWD